MNDENEIEIPQTQGVVDNPASPEQETTPAKRLGRPPMTEEEKAARGKKAAQTAYQARKAADQARLEGRQRDAALAEELNSLREHIAQAYPQQRDQFRDRQSDHDAALEFVGLGEQILQCLNWPRKKSPHQALSDHAERKRASRSRAGWRRTLPAALQSACS